MKKLFLILIICAISISIFAEEDHFEGKQEDSEMEALRKWIREKRMITIKEIGGDLSLSGEVRVEMQDFNEKKNGIRQRGASGAIPKPDVAYDIEVNLMLDYHTERTWASVKLEFDNDMGIDSGTTNHLAVEKAYFGGRVINGETFTFDIEMGRRFLDNVFESKVEFGSLFDGALFKFSKAYDSIGNFYVNTGVFIIDDYRSQYGQVAEMGFLQIMNTGFFVKYSFINWKKKFSDPARDRRFSFGVSQATTGFQGTIWGKFCKFYAAGLYNHFAKTTVVTNFQKYPWAWYTGFSVGRIFKAKDWALDVNYQYVMPQAIPDFDVSGIKRGNAAGVGLYTANINGTGALMVDSKDPVGSCNYQGLQFEFLYAITDNLTLLENFQISTNQTNNVGPEMRYKKFEIEFIYAF